MGPPGQTPGGANPSTTPTIRSSVTHRTVLAQDILNAHEIHLYYSHQDPDIFPGTTSLVVSKEVFNELKSKGEAPFTYRVYQPPTMQGAVSNLLSKLENQNSDLNLQDLMPPSSMTPVNCTLRKAEPNDVAFPLMNNKPVELPAIHAVCKSDQDELHLYFLDDLENPLGLADSSRLGHFHGQATRITFPEEKAANQIEQDSKQNGRAQIYGIYFDFASAKIRPQSQPVLQEIAQALKDNPAWKLSIEGHTDNIGGDASNLDLSQRRAAAVKQALSTQHHIAAARFTTAGFGASHPLDSNDTIEGRARNRRVELVRQ